MEDDNWDLQAVVRGSCGRSAAAASSSDPLSSFFHSLQQVEAEDNLVPLDDLCPFIPDLLPTTTYAAFEELEEFCKPFFHKSPLPQHLHQQQQAPVPISPGSRRTIASSSSPSPIPLLPDGPLLPSHSNRPPPQTTPRSKRRKNQQKKVVCHVPADGLSSDKWAWRKYGQKPIKGSPYPRGYYRCSSSKGCLARKQVERSRTDPAIFVITYTAEHNHPVPTHRNSLAGSTRNKFPQPSASSQVNAATEGPIAPDLSPRTPLTASMDDDFLLLQPKREEVVDYDEGEVGEEDDDGILLVSEMDMAGDDQVLFVGLDHQLPGTPSAGGGISDEFQGAFSSAPWEASSEAAVAGGS